MSVGRGEVGLPEKEELGPPSSSAQTQGLLPLQSLPVSPRALGTEAQEAVSSGGSPGDPLRKEAGCSGPGEQACVCVVCVHENWHMCTCVAGTTRAYRCRAGMRVRNQIF